MATVDPTAGKEKGGAKPESVAAPDPKALGKADAVAETKLDDVHVRTLYREVMKGHLVGQMPEAAIAGHKYASDTFATSAASKELRQLKRLLPVDFDGSALVRFNKAKPGMIQLLIIGAEGTPYESGCFAFDVALGPEYPSKSPKANLMTTGGGSVRFNPNLYNCGKVCLSLLGTWAGPGWTKDSSLLQVIVSIQSLVMTPRPWFNEPGRGHPVAKEANTIPLRSERPMEWNQGNGGYDYIRAGTVAFAIRDMIKHPAPGFEDAILDHFYLKRDSIKALLEQWRKDSEGAANAAVFKASIDETIAALNGMKARKFSKKVVDVASKAVEESKSEGGAGAAAGGGGGGGGGGGPAGPAKPTPLESVKATPPAPPKPPVLGVTAPYYPAPVVPAPVVPAVTTITNTHKPSKPAPKKPAPKQKPNRLEKWKKDQAAAEADRAKKVALAKEARAKRLLAKKALQAKKKLELATSKTTSAAVVETEKGVDAKAKVTAKPKVNLSVSKKKPAPKKPRDTPKATSSDKGRHKVDLKILASASGKASVGTDVKVPEVATTSATWVSAKKGKKGKPQPTTAAIPGMTKRKPKRMTKKELCVADTAQARKQLLEVAPMEVPKKWTTVAPRRAPRAAPRLVRRRSDE